MTDPDSLPDAEQTLKVARAKRYRAYPAYRLSKVDWLGEIPASWQLKRMKYVASINDETLPESTDSTYEFDYVDIGNVSPTQGIIAKEPQVFEDAPSRARRIVRHGDTIVSTVRTYLRAIAPVREPEDNLIVSTGFAVVRPRTIDPDYLSFVLCSPYFVETVVSRSTGVSYPAINSSEIGEIPIPIPSGEEQKFISAFIDERTKKIDNLIKAKWDLLKLLKEKRQNVITHAVTKGINPKVKLKPTGMNWLDDIPEHWTNSRIKWIAQVRGRIGFRGYTTEDLVEEDKGALVLGGSNLTSCGKINLSKRNYISWEKYYESPEIVVECGDLLVGQRGTCGRPAIIEDDIGAATINPSLVLLKKPKANSGFLCYWLMSNFAQNLFASFLSATAVPMLSQEQISNVPVFLPPDSEQRSIVSYLDAETVKLDALSDAVEVAIVRLEQYRSALIFAAVSGKIDVRRGAI